MKKKNGFTLAETLITLLIIGVVAAITVPALISGYQDRQFNTAKEKAKTTLANGYKKMISAEVMTFTDMPVMACRKQSDKFKCLKEAHKGIFSVASEFTGSSDELSDQYLRRSGNTEITFNWRNDVPYAFKLADGTVVGFVYDDDNTSFSLVVDLNGKKSPNRALKDLVKFRIDRNGSITDVSGELDDSYYTGVSGATSYWPGATSSSYYPGETSWWPGETTTSYYPGTTTTSYYPGATSSSYYPGSSSSSYYPGGSSWWPESPMPESRSGYDVLRPTTSGYDSSWPTSPEPSSWWPETSRTTSYYPGSTSSPRQQWVSGYVWNGSGYYITGHWEYY